MACSELKNLKSVHGGSERIHAIGQSSGSDSSAILGGLLTKPCSAAMTDKISLRPDMQAAGITMFVSQRLKRIPSCCIDVQDPS